MTKPLSKFTASPFCVAQRTLKDIEVLAHLDYAIAKLNRGEA